MKSTGNSTVSDKEKVNERSVLETAAAEAQSPVVPLVLRGEGAVPTALAEIVSIESPTDPTNQLSNNKIVYFKHREPGVLVDFTASRHIAERLHLTAEEMVEVYRGIYVNKMYIKKFDGRNILVDTFGEQPHRIPVSRTHKREVRIMVRPYR